MLPVCFLPFPAATAMSIPVCIAPLLFLSSFRATSACAPVVEFTVGGPSTPHGSCSTCISSSPGLLRGRAPSWHPASPPRT
eukprot:3490664-Lingulodinium_polyedra.AAC.1